MVTGKPVKLPVTGFNFQLPVTDLRTFFLHIVQFSTSSSSHTHTDEQRQVYTGNCGLSSTRKAKEATAGHSWKPVCSNKSFCHAECF